MTTYYVGTGGNDALAGTSWALRRLTIGSADGLMVSGDTLFIGPGTYRELRTLLTSGSPGLPVTWTGDYTGANTDGVGGVVRMTGSDDDKVATRANCVTGTNRSYRTFKNMQFDMTSNTTLNNNGGSNWNVQQCFFNGITNGASAIICSGAAGNHLWDGCFFFGVNNIVTAISHSATFDNSGTIIQNCIWLANNGRCVSIDRVGGIVIRNCLFLGGTSAAVRVTTALSVGQVCTVNNCIVAGLTTGFQATTTAEFNEDFNNLWANGTARSLVNVGANSQAYPGFMDPRWFYQLVFGAAGSQVLSAFDMASFSQLVNLAGTSPPASDLRGTTIQGAQREWGPLEYLPTLATASAPPFSAVLVGGVAGRASAY